MCYPSARGAAGEDQSVGSDRETYFAGLHCSLVPAIQYSVKHVAQYGGLQSGGVGVYQHEERCIREKKGTALQEGENTVLYFPDLALGASAVGGRIHDDRVVVIAPADFTFYELSAVIHKPADMRLAQT